MLRSTLPGRQGQATAYAEPADPEETGSLQPPPPPMRSSTQDPSDSIWGPLLIEKLCAWGEKYLLGKFTKPAIIMPFGNDIFRNPEEVASGRPPHP